MHLNTVLFSICLCLIFSPTLIAQPNINKLIKQHAKAMGGLKKWEKLESYQQVYEKEDGTILTITCQMPDKIIINFKKAGFELSKIYDGEHAYILRNGVYEPMRQGEAIEMAEELYFYTDLMMVYKNNQELTYLGEEELDGTPCYKLKLSKSATDEQVYWLNTKNYLIEQTGEYSEDKAHEGIYYKTRLLNYQDVDGYMFPFKQALIPGSRRLIISEVKSTKVNLEFSQEDFHYRPNSTANLIRYWKDRYTEKSIKAFTFAQETIRFKDGAAQDTLLWYEAISFPDRFRIDIGHGRKGNINLFRNDSIYVLRKGELVDSGHRVPEALVMKGALYGQPIDSTLTNLQAMGIDIDVFRKSTYKERPAFVIGAKEGDDKSPQIWVDAERRNVLRRVNTLKNGKTLTAFYDDFVEVAGHWVESWVEFHVDGTLVQTERYKDINMKPELSDAVFDPNLYKASFWY